MSILAILDELDDTDSRLKKEAILTREKNNALLRKVVKATLDPTINYYIKKIPNYKINKSGKGIALEFAIDTLNDLSSRRITGNAAIDFLRDTLEALHFVDAAVLERIVERDLKCGVNEATINKIWAGMIPTFDVCLAHKDTSFITYPAFAQVKMDGARCHLMWDGKDAKLFSRNGKQFDVGDVFNQTASLLMKDGETWDGELLFFENGKALDRKTSNGIANKALKGTISTAEAAKAVFVCWDIVDVTSTIPYAERWVDLSSRFLTDMGNFKLVDSKVVNSAEEAQGFYLDMIALKEEGAILKNFDFKWEPKRVKGMGKVKAEEDADLRVVGWEEGTGRNEGRLGALVCETSCGGLRVNVGSGFSDQQRDQFDQNIIGKIITVRYNQIVDDKNKSTKSLFLPRFIELREDKDIANTLGELK